MPLSGQRQDGLFLECGASLAWYEAWATTSFLQDCWWAGEGAVTPFLPGHQLAISS